MLLAAGRGERLRPLTDCLPKPLVEVRGRSLIERHLETLAGAGIERVVINMGWLGDQLVERLGSGERYGLSIVFSDERDGILETAGGIRNALPLLGRAPFLVVNADIFTDMPLPCPRPAADELAHLVLVPKPSFKATGDFGVALGRLVNEDAPAYTFSGVATYRPEFFADLEPGRRPLAPLLREAADAGRIGASVYEGTWEDVGTAERLAALNA
ncbi:MAG: nucleotidyltransferase family protein [Woeseiaceae bacterium]|jgi:MurNAc alpha-1-phosphate uridylyltransferase|nr:nucleotidyltransferase family protein [Woeseiaceae bacterium]